MKFLLFILILVSSFSFSQSNKEYRKQKSIKQIKELKKGTLLVRLRVIDDVLKDMYDPDTLLVSKQLEYENKIIISAFKENYNFSKVVFFYNSYSTSVRNKELMYIFVNSELKIDKSISINDSLPIFVADFGYTDQNITNGQNGVYSVFSLNIRDNEFIQLYKPFPYYVKTKCDFYETKLTNLNKELLNKSNRYFGTVNSFNNRLNNFHEKIN